MAAAGPSSSAVFGRGRGGAQVDALRVHHMFAYSTVRTLIICWLTPLQLNKKIACYSANSDMASKNTKI
jgi:hypothetical protein